MYRSLKLIVTVFFYCLRIVVSDKLYARCARSVFNARLSEYCGNIPVIVIGGRGGLVHEHDELILELVEVDPFIFVRVIERCINLALKNISTATFSV